MEGSLLAYLASYLAPSTIFKTLCHFLKDFCRGVQEISMGMESNPITVTLNMILPELVHYKSHNDTQMNYLISYIFQDKQLRLIS